jgi:hypothetical protein
VFKILYYDIGWDVHTAEVEAESVEDAIEKLLQLCVCTRADVITVYPPDERQGVP